MKNGDIRIVAVGDCSNWNQNHIIQEDLSKEIREIISDCDVFIFNLEGPIIDGTIQPKEFVTNRLLKFILRKFRKLQPLVTNSEKILNILNLTPINVACLANNHMWDAGSEGIDHTLRILKLRNFYHVGAGMNYNDASKALIFTIKGKKIAILNYNFIGWRKFGIFIDPFAAGAKHAGVNHGNRKKIIDDIKSLRSDVDFIIVALHIGKVLHRLLSHNDKKFVASLKADLVIIHHPHISQSINSNNVYSLGDFIFLSPNSLQKRPSKILICTISKNNHEIEILINNGLPIIPENSNNLAFFSSQ